MYNYGATTCTNQCFGGCAPYDSGSGNSPSCHLGTCDTGYYWPATYYSGAYQQLPAGAISYIQQELYNFGPLQACYTVYENFYSFFGSYPTGIYTQASGNVVGGHCVKLIGWGVENNVPYWLFANSWDYNFGDNGYFKMLRGSDLCGIEDVITEGFTQRQSIVANIKGIQPNITKMMVGGWHQQADMNAEFIRTAAAAAIELVSKKLEQEFNLEKVAAAETQVVAGLNFRLTLGVQDGQVLRVVLHRNLKNEYSIMEHQLQ
jgi:cathepsin B